MSCCSGGQVPQHARYKNRLLSYCENLLIGRVSFCHIGQKSIRRNILSNNLINHSCNHNETRIFYYPTVKISHTYFIIWHIHVFTVLIARTWATFVLRRSLQHSKQPARRVSLVFEAPLAFTHRLSFSLTPLSHARLRSSPRLFWLSPWVCVCA